MRCGGCSKSLTFLIEYLSWRVCGLWFASPSKYLSFFDNRRAGGCLKSIGMHFASSYTLGVWATRADARRRLPVHMGLLVTI